MSTDRVTRIRGVQLPLPLTDTDPASGPAALPDPGGTGGDGSRPTGEGGDDERPWRLDDHTRQVGIRGVAEARARLRAGPGRAA